MGRATATILFTDLVGSTELRGRVGDDAAEELRRSHDRVLARAVEMNGGRVVKGLGDGIMATFPAAADAVAAAVGIQQAVDRHHRAGGESILLQVRVGLSLGDVIFEDGDVHGPAVIEAARLCSAAAGGQILASDIVRMLARHAAEYVAIGALDLKGLADPLAACEVLWERLPVSTIPLPSLLTDLGRVFVGRHDELERLQGLWQEAAAGERRMAFLAGEPGVGKTRLAAELAIRVHGDGAAVLAGRCDEGLGVPYQPFVEALRHFIDHTPAERLPERLGRYAGDLVRLVPDLNDRLPVLPPPVQSDPETERYRLFDAVVGWLSASDGAVLLVADDLQWAAKPTVLLLRHILRSPDSKGLLVVGTYRDTELSHDHPLVDLLADLRRTEGAERVSLAGLDSAAVTTYIESAGAEALGGADVASLARVIYEETDGNPFFIREVLRHLSETGALRRSNGLWDMPPAVEQLGIPEGVRDVVGRRLARLSEATRQTLAVAAVIAHQFDFPVLGAAGDVDDERLLGALEEAGAARLVTEVPGRGPRYRFSHALVRDVLYGDLSPARRITLHRRVAEAIEKVHGEDLDDHLPALAHHWDRAWAPGLDPTRAVEYLTRAGDRALSQLAPDEAVAYYQQALELAAAAPNPDDTRHLQLLISLGTAQRSAGEPGHRDTLLTAARIAQRQGDADALARAALENIRGSIFSRSGVVDGERVAVIEAALQTIPAENEATRARLLGALGLELHFEPDRARRVACSDEAVRLARRSGDPATLAYALAARYYATLWPGNTDERLADTDELLVLAGTLADPVVTAWAHWLSWRLAMETARVDDAKPHLERLEGLVDGLGQPTLSWGALVIRASTLLQAGRLADAEQVAAAAADLGQRNGQPDAALVFADQLFGIRREQGRLGEIHPTWLAVAERYPTLPLTRAVLACLESELDRHDEARRRLDELATNGFDDIPLDALWLLTLSCAATAAVRTGAVHHAERLYERLQPFGDQLAGVGEVWLGSVHHHLGLLATALGRDRQAETHFAAAVAAHDRPDTAMWLARTRLEWAGFLLARSGDADTDRARTMLDQALAIARELGLASIERRTIALRQDCLRS